MIDKIIFYLYSSLFIFAPLLMSPFTSELFEFNKMLFIYLIAILLIFFWLIQGLIKKQLTLVRTTFDLVILFFLSSQVLATVFSIDVYTSIVGYYGRFNGGLLSLFTYLALFYILIIFFDFNKLEKLLKLSVFSSFITILWGLPGKLGFDLSCFVFVGRLGNSCWTDQFRPAERIFSTLGQPNWLGAYLVINFFIGAYFFLCRLYELKKNEKTSFPLIFYSCYLVLNFLVVIFTRSRSALVAVIFGIVILAIYWLTAVRKDISHPVRRFYGITILAVFCLLIVIFKTGVDRVDNLLSLRFLQPQKTNQIINKSTPPVIFDSNVTNSLDIRKVVWQGAWELGKKYPVFGTGVETFAYSYYFVRPASHNLTSEWDYLYNRAHNEYLNYLATTGFLGLTAYLALIFLTIFLFTKQLLQEKEPRPRFYYLCLLLAYFSILITNFFGFSTTTISLFFYLIPGFYFIKIQESKKDKKTFTLHLDQQSSLNYYFLQPIAWILVSVLLVFSLKFVVFYYLADLKYAEANSLFKVNRLQESANDLNEALQLHYEHVYEDKLANVLANLAYAASFQKEKEMSEKLVALAQYYSNKSISASPKNILYWKTKAKNQYLFYKINLKEEEIEKGISALQTAQKLAPTDPKIPYSLALFYSLLYDETKDKAKLTGLENLSLIEIDKAISLKPNSRDNYFFKGQLLKKYKKNSEAKKIFEGILKNFNAKDEEVKKELQGL